MIDSVVVLILPLALCLAVILKGDLAVRTSFQLFVLTGCAEGIAISLTAVAMAWVWWLSR